MGEAMPGEGTQKPTADFARQRENLSLHQANERTLLAWIRTGIALMAFGFAIARFGLFLRQLARLGAGPANDGLGSGWLGALLVLFGIGTNLAATLRYRATTRAIESQDVLAPGSGAVLWLGALATALGLLMMGLLLRSM